MEDEKFLAARLRRVVVMLGLADAVPMDDKSMAGCAGTILGMVARQIESLQAGVTGLKQENEELGGKERAVATLMCEWKTGRIDGDTLADRLFSLFASEPAIGSDTDRLRKETAKRCVEIAQVFCRESAWCRPNKPCAPCQIANSIATEFGL